MFNYLRRVIEKLKHPPFPYWTSSIYGYRRWISRYGYYPSFLPLCIYSDHGPADAYKCPAPHELQSDAPVQFYYCKTTVEKWKRQSRKECHVMSSPFIFARRQLNIRPLPERIGSIFFVSHGTSYVVDQNSCEVYHSDIMKLPERYKPVKICLHINEIKLGYKQVYEKLGYQVVTAGDTSDQNFTERFYRILSTARYTFSNLFGAYALYSVEMGIPFCLYGTGPKYLNEGDLNVELGEYTSYLYCDYYKRAVMLFSQMPEDQVTPEQTAFARYSLGLDEGVSRLHMSWILYKSLVIWVFGKVKVKFGECWANFIKH